MQRKFTAKKEWNSEELGIRKWKKKGKNIVVKSR